MATRKKAAKKTSRVFQLRKNQLARVTKTNSDLIARMQSDLKTNQSIVSIILGVLIVVVLGISIFNFLNKPSQNLGPASQTQNLQNNQTADVSKDNLPGKYTVKEGDTLFDIAQNYYGDGYQYPKIAEANKIANPDVITTGQVIDIPKLEVAQAAASQPAPSGTPNTQLIQGGTGGSVSETEWGSRITGTTYTVQDGDWLSKIAGRAYGDIYQYGKIAQANNIQDPNTIEPGAVLQIPR